MSHAENPPQATPGLSSLKLPPRLNVTLGTPAATLTTPMLPSMGIAAALDPPRIPDLLPPPVEPDSARALVDRSSFFKASPSGLARRSLSSIWNVEEFSEDLEVSPTKPTKRLDDAVPAPAPPPPLKCSQTHKYVRRMVPPPAAEDEAPSLFKSIGDAAARWSLGAAPEPPPPPEEEDAEVAWTVGTPPTRSAFLSGPAAARVYASPTREESHFPDRGDPNAPWVRSLLQAELESYQLSPGAAPPQPPPEARSLAEAASARSDLQSPSLLDKLLGYMPTPSAFVCVGQKHDGDGLRPGDRARSRSEPFPLDDAPSRPLETSAPVAIPGDASAPQKARRKKPPPLDTSRSPTSPARLPRAAYGSGLAGVEHLAAISDAIELARASTCATAHRAAAFDRFRDRALNHVHRQPEAVPQRPHGEERAGQTQVGHGVRGQAPLRRLLHERAGALPSPARAPPRAPDARRPRSSATRRSTSTARWRASSARGRRPPFRRPRIS